jgi:RNA recognition motif-containing protein
MSEASRLKNTIYVGGLDQAVTVRTLSEAFIPFGEIVDISLPKPDLPSSTDVHRGFGYIEFENFQDSKEAIDNMDQSELYGRIIKVAPAKPQKDSNEGLGSKTAIWQQVDTRILLSFTAFARAFIRVMLTILCRRVTWHNMRSAKRTGSRQRSQTRMATIDRMIQCRD